MMKKNPLNPGLGVKTGKDLLNLFKSKEPKGNNGVNGDTPENETEGSLHAIWSGLLGHESFGRNDDFFQVGGNSLKGVQAISRISKQFKVNLQLTDIFLNPTIAGLASVIVQQQKTGSSSAISTGNRPNRIPLSFSQERLWFIDQLEGSVQYHLPAVFRLQGKLDVLALNNALQTIVNRHEILRTVFVQQDGNTWQHVNGKDQWKLSFVDATGQSDKAGDLPVLINDIIKKPFDLSNDHMIRVSLIALSDEEHVLVVTMHHIASDGWSTSVLVKEVVNFYNAYAYGQPIPDEPLQIQYADFAIWQRNYLQGEVLETKLKYWKQKLQGTTPLELYTDFA